MLEHNVHILSVALLTEQLRRNLEKSFSFVWVRGEIANYRATASGHIYFTLKDSDAQLQCVWFRGRQAAYRKGGTFDPLTGEVYAQPRSFPALTEGLEIVCAGQISVYAARGQYQLVVEFVQATGDGLQALAFEELKKKLSAAGYFALERKRKIPANPEKIALVTSPSGAAIHDFLKLAESRGHGSKISLFPVLVQGAEAAKEIVAALALANKLSWADVIVLIRGGGAAEDLRAFNEEIVATAIFDSHIPVLAGIGHEVDTSLADMTADVRAATPSHAATLLWTSKRDMEQEVDELEMRLQQAFTRILNSSNDRVASLCRTLHWFSPEQRLQRNEEQCAVLQKRLVAGLDKVISQGEYALHLAGQRLPDLIAKMADYHEFALDKLETRLCAHDPYAPMRRGYALVQTPEGEFVRSVSQTHLGQDIDLVLNDGVLGVKVEDVRTA